MNEHPRDDLGAYALEALDPAEYRIVDAHVRACAACRSDVAAYRAALESYAAAAETDASPLRAKIVARAVRRESPWAWLRRPVPVFVPVALALVLVIALAGVVTTRAETDRYAAALADVAGGRVVALTAAGSDMRGTLVIPESGAPYLLLRVPPPPAGRAWEAWVLHAATPIPAGLARSGGVVTLTLTAPLGPGDGVAVTLEPAAGSDAPTSEPVLVLQRT